MATIYNSELSKELLEGAKIQVHRDSVPTQLAEKVVPVMEVNPKLLRRVNVLKRNSAVNSTSATILAVAADRDFYLTSAFLSVIKDATSTSVSSNITATIDGVSSNLLSIAELTLTAQSSQSNMAYTPPIKIDSGTNISVTNSTNVANITAIAGITGYYSDIPKA